jgi:hypothetical protein
MAIITKIPGVTFTDTALPKLYRDSVINTGTEWVYDALDTYSYPAQSAPTAGDVWGSLTPAAANATLSGTGVGFSGGFTKTGAGYFNAPATGKVAASADGLLFVIWFKYGTQATSGNSGIAGLFDSNAVNQYGLTVDNNVSNGNMLCRLNNGASGMAILNSVPSGTIYQIAMSLKKQTDGTYVGAFYKNGVLLESSAAGSSIAQPVATAPRIGSVASGAYSGNFQGTIYRSFFDNTSALADQAAITALVLKDYTDNVSRFT